MSPRSLIPSLAALTAVLACCTSSAQAAFAPFTLVSGDPELHLQADYAYDPAVSGNGEYVAYTGSIASKPGIYRTDLATGQEEVVALGADTGAPSISAEGRYISFTTNDNPATGEAPTSTSKPAGECSSVYRRDMSKAPAEAGAFTLVSASDESSESLTYAPATAGQPCGGATASRVAMSADGSKVAFTILSSSSLTGACTTASPITCPTPADQVAVRNLTTNSTTLVSVTLDSLGKTPQPVPLGAALAGSPVAPAVTNSRGSISLPIAGSTAAISADGDAVAWMGTNIPTQAPITDPQPKIFDLEGHSDSYAEPLWRYIGEEPTAPIRRILAGDEPSAANCPPECPGGLDFEFDNQDKSPYGGLGPAYGSFTEAQQNGFSAGASFNNPLERVTPQLSADGMTVALLSNQPNYPAELKFGAKESQVTTSSNAFVVNMAPNLTRAQSITRLTEWGSLEFNKTELDGTLTSIAISPDGTRVAFSTQRAAFPLAPPALITPPPSKDEVTQLYEANLQSGRLALVSEGDDGEAANAPVDNAAFSDDGETLALASAATNLAVGTVNDGSDVFVTHEVNSPAVTGEESVSPLPSTTIAADSPWQISATASQEPSGALLVDVSVPGAGSLAAGAGASVPTTEVAKIPSRGKAHRARTRKVIAIAKRQVARASISTRGLELVQVQLDPSSRYRSLTRGKGGLYATITVTFTAKGHRPLTQTLQASFEAKRTHKKAKPKPRRRANERDRR